MPNLKAKLRKKKEHDAAVTVNEKPTEVRLAPPLPSEPPATRSGQVYELGPLNRHWYRRCLDALDARLRESSTNPSIQDLKELCDDVVTGFLTAITGQAPDSSRLQFPADRAYFIPFEGDLAESFNFTKPFYRVAEEPSEGQEEGLPKHSIWSFYPWVSGDKRIEIDRRRSVDAKGGTTPFEEMVSVRAQFVKDELTRRDRQAQDGTVFLLEKSLVVRGKDRSYPEGIFFGADDLGARQAWEEISKSCADSMLGIFDVYRRTPGNVAVESILLNHVTIIRWLLAMLGQKRRDVQEGKVVPVSEQDKDFKELFLGFLRYLFLDVSFGGGVTAADEERLKSLKGLADLLEPRPSGATGGVPKEGDGARSKAVALLAELATKTGRLSSSQRRRKFQEELAKGSDDSFEALRADLESFRKYLLQVGSEDRIAQDLTEALAGKLLKAGEIQQSFVWVTPDFEKINDSLLTDDFKVERDVQDLSADITEAYKTFYKRFDAFCVEAGGRREKLEAYWRTLGQTNQDQLVFSSFENTEAGLFRPLLNGRRSSESNRPQSFFVRVRICDSLNEPVINGLFVLSTDHDEVAFKEKPQDLRREDREDLLAFAKVYFFIVRDYFRALDQAQEARDIGRLNQYLYDRRLSDLDQRMQRRIRTQEFSQGNITDRKNWSQFSYEIINNYALSLIEKLDDVQSETFPYDRLLILPLGVERVDVDYYLPFFLFQAIFAERLNGEIRKGLYSLIKPFQSPVEERESEPGETRERFRVKSFQKVSKTGKGEVRLDRYLEKLYVSADDRSPDAGEATRQVKEKTSPRAGDTVASEPESFVVKLFREGAEPDLGRDWVQQAVASFWSRRNPDSATHLDLWVSFLHRLTESFETLRSKDRTNRETAEEQWFLLRLGLLRVLLAGKDEGDDKQLRKIGRSYKKILRLRFNNDRSLDVIKWAKEADPFAKLAERLSRLAEGMEIQFEPFALRGEDPFILDFFRHLTNLVSNQYDDKGWTDRAQATWFQPLLTRPLEEREEPGEETSEVEEPTAKPNAHVSAGAQIENRIPPYPKIEAGQHALSMFLGVVNFGVGHGKQRSRLRCLIVMIRDYDDAQTGAGLTQQEREQQLEVDRRDLSLYTTTFFRNVQKFVEDALAREENRVLSTDISQIARNWYSSGVDQISRNLRQRLDQLAEDRTDFRLGGLRPEIVDTLFDSMLEVLLRTEEQPDVEGRKIPLESFPFDRLLHIPLGLGAADGARLCYARTRIVDVKAEKESWSSLNTRQCYERIRTNGRTWPQSNGRKKPEKICHLGFADKKLAAPEELTGLLRRIGEASLLDALVRSLYQANAIQTLAVAGLLLHMLGEGEIGPMRQRLEAVVTDSIRGLEQQAGASAVKEVHTEVHMDSKAILRQLSSKAGKGSDGDLRKALQDIRLLPAWYDVFDAIEGASEDCVYGLQGPQGEVASKVFYVYYSIEAPVTFTEIPATGPRFRGIFALIVDDASTDDKSESGEVADQQDIRTFVHNGVRSLQLILENQGLLNRLRQPGIESFVLGMLHRLKNELGKPMAVLHVLGEKSRSKDEREKIEGATSTIEGLKELFKSLRGLGEVQQGVVPIRPFSTYWLGWLFIAKLTVAAHKAAEELEFGTDQLTAPLQELEKIRKHAEKSLKGLPRDPLRATDVIQRELKKVESVLTQFAAVRSPEGQDIVLSFQVFSDVPLEFLGSFHLEEALNILIENAFQAFWDYLDDPLAERTAESGLLRMVCRRSDGHSGEVLIEIGNSSSPIDDSKLEILNNRVAQPMTSQQHASKSGKKGGSGFGHYYARRTVAELCGGREARRDLDVRIGYQEETGLARVSVNLIEASPQGLRPLSAERVQAEVRRNFESAFALAPEEGEGKYNLPQNLDVRSLFNLIRRLLVADREALENRLLNWWCLRVCSKLRDRCDEIRDALLGRLKVLESADQENGDRWREIRAEIDDAGVARVRRGSFHDLQPFLRKMRDREDGALGQIIQGDGLLERLLKDFAAGSGGCDLESEVLVDAGDKETIAKQLAPYRHHLKKGVEIEDAAARLLKDLDKDERGQPVPAKDGVASLLEPAQWKVSNDVTKDNLHLAISLVDGDPNDFEIDFKGGRPVRPEAASDDYRLESQTFQTYARLFERALCQGSPVGGLWLERSPKPPRRTVFLVLKKQEEMEAGR